MRIYKFPSLILRDKLVLKNDFKESDWPEPGFPDL